MWRCIEELSWSLTWIRHTKGSPSEDILSMSAIAMGWCSMMSVSLCLNAKKLSNIVAIMQAYLEITWETNISSSKVS